MASDSSNGAIDESESEGNDGVEEQYFAVRANAAMAFSSPVELNVIKARCKQLLTLMRDRPTLPLGATDTPLTATDLEAGLKLPLSLIHI